MKAFPHLFAKLFASPLMLEGSVRHSFEFQLLSHMGLGHAITAPAPQAGPAGVPGKPWDLQDYQDMKATSEKMRIDDVLQVYRNVAVVKVSGVIDKAISQMDIDCYGGCDLADVDRALAIAGGDPAIDTIVLNMDTPGGSVTGTPETAMRVNQLAGSLKEGGYGKEVHAYIATKCCSGGYYIASQADRIAAAPSSRVGSIGVYMALLDETRALEMEGIKVELMKAGKFKAMGASFKPLTDEERAMLQANVDEIWANFKAACLYKGREISDADMQGQSFDGTAAEQKGLVDELTLLNLDEYVTELIR